MPSNTHTVLRDEAYGTAERQRMDMYLPVDKILEQRNLSPAAAAGQPNRAPAASAAAEASTAIRDREDRRTREAR